MDLTDRLRRILNKRGFEATQEALDAARDFLIAEQAEKIAHLEAENTRLNQNVSRAYMAGKLRKSDPPAHGSVRGEDEA